MEWLYLMKWSYKKFLYLRLELFLILNEWLRKRPLRVWDVSPTYWAPQPLAVHVITHIRFELFQSVSLSILMPYLLPLMEDVMVDSHEMWWHVKHLLALHIEILENLLLIIWFERRKDFAVRAELEIGGDFEFGELKWRGEIVTLVVVNSFLHETPGRWSVDTEGNLRGVSKTRGDLCLKFSKFVAIFDDPVEARQRFRSVKESSTKQSQNSNEVIMTLETPGRGEPCYNAPHCSWE